MRTARLAGALLPLVLATSPAEARTGMTPMPALAPPPGAIEALNLSPTSRTVPPVAVQGTSGSVADPQNVLPGQPTRLSGTDSSITLDFGKEVGGRADPPDLGLHAHQSDRHQKHLLGRHQRRRQPRVLLSDPVTPQRGKHHVP
jgi:hypothetical protein